ncbi:MAG: hypothetical protein JO061_15690 [Acidobacteriaceae bacterium]|nr:hypothetical protein [Acidobacteriaceae bacterium]
MKGWLETRWRLLYGLAIPLITLLLPRVTAGADSVKDASTFMVVLAFFGVFNAAYLGGAGIRTQSPFAAMKGLHGSTYYTLSLPVSRMRVISVRVALGLLEFAAVVAAAYIGFWLLLPAARGNSTLFDLFELIVTAVACSACFYFASVLLATFLDDPWQPFGGVFLAIVVWLGASRLSIGPRFNVFGFAGAASPLITHTIPWPAIAISFICCAVLFVVALRIADRREY